MHVALAAHARKNHDPERLLFLKPGALRLNGHRFSTPPVTSIVAFVFALGASEALRGQDWGKVERTATIRDPRITEVSGMVVAAGRPERFWTHNDSGDDPRIFLLRPDGRIDAEVRVDGAAANDWEDIAAGPGRISATGKSGPRLLYLSDTGNNSRRRSRLSLYRLPEPPIDGPNAVRGRTRSAPAERMDFRYPKVTFDCEAMFVHPQTGMIYLLTKHALAAQLFRLDWPADQVGDVEGVQTATHLKTLRPGFMVTAADIDDQGNRVLVRTYLSVLEYTCAPNEPDFEKIFDTKPASLPASLTELKRRIDLLHAGRTDVRDVERRESTHRCIG